MHCVDLGESFPPSIYLQKSASIQPRTSPSKFGGKFNSSFICLLRWSARPAGKARRSSRSPFRAASCCSIGAARRPAGSQSCSCRGSGTRAGAPTCAAWLKGSISKLTLVFHPNDQTLSGSFSAVSTPNIRWKALDEIYKIYMLLHRSDLNIIFQKISSNFFAVFGKF